MGSKQACEEGEESRVLETPHVDWVGQWVSAKHVQHCKTYLHGEGWGLNEPVGEVGSKVLESQWMACTGCGLSNRHQQSIYSTCKTYIHGGGSKWGLNKLAGRGGVQGPSDARHGLWIRQQITYSICKCTYMEGGLKGVRMSLQGRGGVQDATCGLWAGPQVSARRIQYLEDVRTWRGVVMESERACEEGESPRRANGCRLWAVG
jgi:hypothetical protein